MSSHSISELFHSVTIHDIEIISRYLEKTEYCESNHNIVNMIEWLDLYPLYYYVEEEYMILIGQYHGEYFMYMPLCEKKYFMKAVHKAKELFVQCGVELILSCFTREYKDLVVKEMPHVIVDDLRDGYDYIYIAEDLRTFRGKKLQKKRNHINRFLVQYQDRYSYEGVDHRNLEEVKEYILSLEATEETKIVERAGILMILELFDVLSYKAGILRVDGRIEGFILASPLKGDMIQENIEKANHEIPGLYQMLMKEFFQRNYLECQYINREDDMGLKDLRKSKLSYHPSSLLEKYRLRGI